MSPATIDDIKKELQKLPPRKVLELTLKLARFKKENKELLSFLLFEADDQQGYVQSLQLEIEEMFKDIHKAPSAVVKKQLRRITKLITRQSKYIGSRTAAVELHVHFCKILYAHPENLLKINSAITIFQQQLNKASKLIPLLEDDLQYDYKLQLANLEGIDAPKKRSLRSYLP